MALWIRRTSSRPSRSAPSGYPPAFSPVLAVALVLIVSISAAGCDSFSAGSSGLTFTSGTQVITAPDSTVSLTLTNETGTTIRADFFCGLAVQRQVDGEWLRPQTVDPVCARILPAASRDLRSRTPSRTPSTAGNARKAPAHEGSPVSTPGKSYIGPSFHIRPGESRSKIVALTASMREATALRFRLFVTYPKGAFSQRDDPFSASTWQVGPMPETAALVRAQDIVVDPNVETATIISDEIRVDT